MTADGRALRALPQRLTQAARERWRAAQEHALRLGHQLADADADLLAVVAVSDFVAQVAERFPREFTEFWRAGRLAAGATRASIRAALRMAIRKDAGAPVDGAAATERDHASAVNTADDALVDDERSLKGGLRRWRALQQAGIVYRDLLRINDLEATVTECTVLAEVGVVETLAWLYRRACAERGTPIGADSGKAQQLVVLAMGKLGACELNLSSDIDLIFAYPEGGETTPNASGRTQTNQAFFVRLAQQLIRALDDQLPEGFVFRVDMRLRPFGDSGALVSSFDALEDYYQEQGRDWERYALIKARPISGDPQLGEALLTRLKPFVYRRYVDFGAMAAMREMKALISRERSAPQFAGDVKLGPGGIREVEFTVAVFQLIFGGRDHRLQQRRVRTLLPLLVAESWLPSDVAQLLERAYVYLRDVEHRLQAMRDEQTQSLPADELDRLRVAVAMGEPDWQAFLTKLNGLRDAVSAHFGEVIAEDEPIRNNKHVWPDPQPDGEQSLGKLGFADPAAAVGRLQALHRAAEKQLRQDVARRRLDEFVPKAIAAAAAESSPDRALAGALHVAESVLRRSAYLVLLNENPNALIQLLKLCVASDRIVSVLSARPMLLDELLDPRGLFVMPEREAIGRELHDALTRLPADDLEQHMDALRAFKDAHQIRVAACEITGALPLMKVSDSLTWLAEAVLEESLGLAWRLSTARLGEPGGQGEFLIVGYGKLGGLELGPASDLDLLYLHNAPLDGVTAGPQSVANSVFFARLTQRLMHVLTTPTAAGVLYEIDMRLRPSGRAGPLVTSLTAFASYQRDEAWTYEHQALVRARPVAGSRALAAQFEKVRLEVLCQRRDRAALRDEVLAMRARMEAATGAQGESADELKKGRGGIIDIEFIVQYLVLAHAADVPDLVRYTDNVRILEAAARHDVLDADRAAVLTRCYLQLRGASHRLALGSQDTEHVDEVKDEVLQAWKHVFGAK